MSQDQQYIRALFDQLVGQVTEEQERILANEPPAIAGQVRELLARAGSTVPPSPAPDVVLRDAVRFIVDLPPGTKIGPYVLLERLGEGGFGSVYKAEQRSPIKRTVAIKIIKSGLDTKDVLARFESERQALARMEHPNIARVIDAGVTESGRPYFAMEHVPGLPITKFADQHKLSINERLILFREVCSAITHAHQKAIIHRDIKSSNVLVFMHDGKPVAKVIDFGIAKALTSDRLTDRTFNTARGMVIGTYESMSPEQAAGDADVDTRTDVYALGVLLYELLTGAPPFDFKRVADDEIRRVIRDVEPPAPSTRLSKLGETAANVARARQLQLDRLTRELRRELEWIPLKAMRKERQRRYESPAQLEKDIENYLSGNPLIAGPESRAYRLRKWIGKHKAPLATTVVIGLVVLAGTLSYIAAMRHGRQLAEAEQIKTKAALDEVERQRSEVEQRQAQAEAVLKFMTQTLANANPRVDPGREVTVRQIMDEAAKVVGIKFKDSPRIEATIRDAIGEQYYYLARYDEARQQFERSLELLRNELGPDHPQTISCLNNLSLMLPREESIALLKPALEDVQSRLGEDHEIAIMIKMNLGVAMCAAGETERGVEMLKDVLARRRRLLGNENRLTTEAMDNLAHFLPLDQAIPLRRESVDIGRRHFKPHDPDLIRYIYNLAITLGQSGESNYAESESLLREVIESSRQLDPNGVIGPMVQLATLLWMQERFKDGEPIWRDIYEWRLQNLPEHSQETAIALWQVAIGLERQERPDEAQIYYKKLFDMGGRAAGKTPDAAGWQYWYCKFLMEREMFVEAEQPLLQCWNNIQANGGLDDARRAIAAGLVTVYERTNKADLAMKWNDELRLLTPSADASTQPATRPSSLPAHN